MKRPLLSLLAAMLSMPPVAAAQHSPSAVASGTRVRLFVIDTVDAGSGELRYTYPSGTIVGFEKDSLVLRSDSGKGEVPHVDTLRIPVTKIGSAEAYAGKRGHVVEGALIGLAVGATAGYVIGDRDYGRSVCNDIAGRLYCANGHPQPARDTAIGAGVAGLAGAAIGYLARTERWSRIDIAGLRLQVGIRP